MQAIIKSVGGTIETYMVGAQTSCTVNVYTGDGALKVTGAAAIQDAVTTTISADASSGDDEVTLASATGVSAGRRYLLGDAASAETQEAVTVRKVSSSTATLVAPLIFDHTAGAAFEGTRLSLAITSVQADALWWDGFADFVANSGSDVQTETVDCVLRRIPIDLIDEVDLRGVFPKGPTGMLDIELDLKLAMREARNGFLRDLGGKFRAHTMLGTEHFRRACALKFWLQQRHAMGSDWKQSLDDVQAEYDHEIAKLQSQIPVDSDQDGATTGVNDGAYTVITLERA